MMYTGELAGATVSTSARKADCKQVRLLEVVLERPALAKDVVLGKY